MTLIYLSHAGRLVARTLSRARDLRRSMRRARPRLKAYGTVNIGGVSYLTVDYHASPGQLRTVVMDDGGLSAPRMAHASRMTHVPHATAAPTTAGTTVTPTQPPITHVVYLSPTIRVKES